jgi:phosphoribosylaminoimidazolecarboxamide formyltransferase / IMP cyclohydrolase
MKKIKSALISVYHKTGLESIIKRLNELEIRIISTGGTYEYIKSLGANAISVESVTDYPSILGGRVKTLHPGIFGGILSRRENPEDAAQLLKYDIPEIDLVIVDLYPFEKTVASTTNEQEIIEKIDIGGISLIRAAAKNFKDVLVVASSSQYDLLLNILNEKNGYSALEDRKHFASEAFNISSHYDVTIFHYFQKDEPGSFKLSLPDGVNLRYGENPHQKGKFFGNLSALFDKLHGKAISYNNLGDLDAGIHLIDEFKENTIAILKHQNACGVASREDLTAAWKDALAGDPVSAFGGVIVSNAEIDAETAGEIDKLFFEVIMAPGFHEKALEILKAKKNRIILRKKAFSFPNHYFRSLLNGVIVQDTDKKSETIEDLKVVTHKAPAEYEIMDLIFANKIVKHAKSNAIVLAKNGQLYGLGAGQTSRVDALKQAILKARESGFDLNGAVMASDAFFPFSDSVEIAEKAGIRVIIQPGGSVRDQDSIDYCNNAGMSMIFTGFRHFRH